MMPGGEQRSPWYLDGAFWRNYATYFVIGVAICVFIRYFVILLRGEF